MKNKLNVLVISFAVFCMIGGIAQSATVVSNFTTRAGAETLPDQSLTSAAWIGVWFKTANAINLSYVEPLLTQRSVGALNATIAIHDAAANRPGASVVSLSQTSSFYHFEPDSPTTLAANTDYWFLLQGQAPIANYDWRISFENPSTGPHQFLGNGEHINEWLTFDGGATGLLTNGAAGWFGITVEGEPVPEPSIA